MEKAAPAFRSGLSVISQLKFSAPLRLCVKACETSSRKPLMNYPCREAKAELRMRNEIWRNGKAV
jgi:hypothetical protein